MAGDETEYIRWFDSLDSDDVAIVGGKNASLGEMIASLREAGVRVPDGFAMTAHAYRTFVAHNDLEERIREQIEQLDGDESLRRIGKAIRQMISRGEYPDDLRDAVAEAYGELSGRYDVDEVDVAARSSATAEDLPEASFAVLRVVADAERVAGHAEEREEVPA